eukprot:PhF_6_TR28354/c0_g1_i1/m.42050
MKRLLFLDFLSISLSFYLIFPYTPYKHVTQRWYIQSTKQSFCCVLFFIFFLLLIVLLFNLHLTKTKAILKMWRRVHDMHNKRSRGPLCSKVGNIILICCQTQQNFIKKK